MLTADQVWGLAVQIDRAHGGYVKRPVYHETLDVVKTEPNKVVLKRLINESAEPTEEEIAEGQRVRAHFNSYTFLALQGRLSEFQHQALKIAQMDSFTHRNQLEFSIISCLPDVARKDRVQRAFMAELRDSIQLNGAEKDTVVGDITVIRTRYSHEYNRYKIDARMGDSFVDFWFPKELKGELRIKGKIKQHRDNNATQLNYVKILVDNTVD